MIRIRAMKITMETDIRDYPLWLKIALAIGLPAIGAALYIAVKYEMHIILGAILFALCSGAFYAAARRNKQVAEVIEEDERPRRR